MANPLEENEDRLIALADTDRALQRSIRFALANLPEELRGVAGQRFGLLPNGEFDPAAFARTRERIAALEKKLIARRQRPPEKND